MPKLTPPPRIDRAEHAARLDRFRALISEAGLTAVLLGPTSSLRYFTGVAWHPSERFTGAIVHASGNIEYVCPQFELEKVSSLIKVEGDILTWQEEDNPYLLIADRIGPDANIGIDNHVALFTYWGLADAFGPARLADAGVLINRLRRQKSPAEISLMQYAKKITLEVQRRAWENMREGVRACEVEQFIDREHRALGADGGNTFCIVSFGEDTSLPHGGEGDRALKEGDVVLIDIGTQYDGYNSDITRTYVLGDPSREVRRVWNAEKEAQSAAFEAARLGATCESVDSAARASLSANGFGPDYRLPGCPHRTGHGIGLDVHEAPNLVRGETTLLSIGMCFSNEPTIVVPRRFGVRLEDHFYMSDAGPRWFTEPSASLDDPFAGVSPQI